MGRKRGGRRRNQRGQFLTVNTAVKISPNGVLGVQYSTLEIPVDRAFRVMHVHASVASDTAPSVFQLALTNEDKSLIGCNLPRTIGVTVSNVNWRPPYYPPMRISNMAATFLSLINRGPHSLTVTLNVRIQLSQNYDLKAVTAQGVFTPLPLHEQCRVHFIDLDTAEGTSYVEIGKPEIEGLFGPTSTVTRE